MLRAVEDVLNQLNCPSTETSQVVQMLPALENVPILFFVESFIEYLTIYCSWALFVISFSCLFSPFLFFSFLLLLNNFQVFTQAEKVCIHKMDLPHQVFTQESIICGITQ